MRSKIVIYINIIGIILLLTSCRMQNERARLESVDKQAKIEVKGDDNKPIEIEPTENTEQKDPETNDFKFSSGAFTEKDIHQLFKMNREEIEEKLGTNYIELFTGVEGAETYEYSEHGITIEYDLSGRVWYVNCSGNVSIYGTNSTMLFDEIQSKLENSVIETWSPEEDEDIVYYILTCEIDNMRIRYISENENGEGSSLRIIRIK